MHDAEPTKWVLTGSSISDLINCVLQFMQVMICKQIQILLLLFLKLQDLDQKEVRGGLINSFRRVQPLFYQNCLQADNLQVFYADFICQKSPRTLFMHLR